VSNWQFVNGEICLSAVYCLGR